MFLLALFNCGCRRSKHGQLEFIRAKSNRGFEYPYFLFIPEKLSNAEKQFVLIEPNNSGFVDDKLRPHIKKAKRTATNDFYIGSYVSQKLGIPLLIPVFPRSQSEWKIYTHALDRDVMLQKDSSMERIDLQLLAMFDDARLRLKKKGINTNEQFFMTGFSASASFANRFTLLHPESVYAVAAGGLNGLLMLPVDSLEQYQLEYPIGVADYPELFTDEFNKSAFLETPQFYFMGENDHNDAVPYDDGYDLNERKLIFDLMGEEMLTQRWEFCQDVYLKNKVDVRFKTYNGMGHEHPQQIKDEVLTFFEKLVIDDLSAGKKADQN